MHRIVIHSKDSYFALGLSYLIEEVAKEEASPKRVCIASEVCERCHALFMLKEGYELLICEKAIQARDARFPIVMMTDASRLRTFNKLPRCFDNILIIDKRDSVNKFRNLVSAVLRNKERYSNHCYKKRCRTCVYRNPLSPVQRMIAQSVHEGLTTQGIATRLGLSHKTVATHKQRIMTRLNIRSRSEYCQVLIKIVELEKESKE
ncbi:MULTISPECIES: helix-turn-helix transcriptional regulator [Cronobacter]|uniref:helix-turn-helix transcriptional regulator n=1 Tax=Cronobacter TaxID=413496 RepID=UPI000A0FE12C|nr:MULTISPECIES: LuxR C-terminal-related transcriptional regulator [Cronobacter]EIX1505831.1 response regulator transcription factor [Cronobacter sakazakii]EIX1527445.1 response regulator transcription factor [Cronobacter sakazakii]EIX1536019.1 response regulator transcription factor [Cronobacter sakazakii]EIX1624585.1 response regulator transcription factor [Cronobacter sakazakii]EIX1665952.1 response regulator transcription factor [Cronobacter sakazakii]